jgi:diguanylate cyclase (GGDEF)-like protein
MRFGVVALPRSLVLVLVLLTVFAGAADAQDKRPAEPVTLQLNWKHQFQFAGYYAAIEKGFYRDAGLQVSLREAREGADPIDAVLRGDAAFGIGASELAMRRGRGEPIVALATILQHSPLVILAAASVVDTVQDLAGKRIMLMPHEAELYAYLRREGITRGRFQEVPHSFDPADLMSGKVDALSGYSSDEPFLLQRAGFAYAVFSPRSAGIDFYADTLFTTERMLRTERRRVDAFLEASLKGWRYAMDHPREIADLILARYSRRHSRDHLLFEAAEIRRLMHPELIEIGYMNPGRWQHIAEIYAELGMLPRNVRLDGFVYRKEEAGPDLVWLYRGLAAAAIAVLAVAVLAFMQRARNRQLHREIASRKAAEQSLREANANLQRRIEEIGKLQEQLREQAMRDVLTGLYNRRYLADALARELARAARKSDPVSLVVIDIDRFKELNDAHGHPAGDAVLVATAQLLAEQIRGGDIAGRWGGEEFVLVLPGMPLASAAQRAEEFRARFASWKTVFDGVELSATLSAGVAAYPEHGATPDALLQAADRALYAAKNAGRDRVCVAETAQA